MKEDDMLEKKCFVELQHRDGPLVINLANVISFDGISGMLNVVLVTGNAIQFPLSELEKLRASTLCKPKSP